MNETISVIVPVYKVEKYIKGCVDSIVGQTYKNLEIILVDDGSPDSCPQILDEYAKKDDRIKVVHKQNGGVSDARNVGLEYATGSYVTFVDGDDTINEKTYEILYDSIKRYAADIAICEVLKVTDNDDGQIILPITKEQDIEEKVLTRSETMKRVLMNGNIGNFPCNKLFKKSLLEGIVFPIGKVYEDAATIFKIIHNADKIIYINQKLYYYLCGRIGATTSSFTEKKILDSLEAYYSQYVFLKENYKEIKDFANLTWVKMYTSAMEKICMNGYNELWKRHEVIDKYESFKEAMDELEDEVMYENLEPYRLISAVLLRHSIETYKKMFKTIFDNIKNSSNK